MNTRDAQLFVRLAESRSFKDTAAQLNVSRATVSKRLAVLEKKFGAILIYRNARSINLTQYGEVLLEQCRIICDAVDSAQQAMQGYGLQPVGTLQLALPTELGTSLLPTLTREFACSYPKVCLSVHFVDGDIDIIGDGFDLAIRLTQHLEDSALIAQRMITTNQVLVASPEYLKQNGAPSDLEQISDHSCLGVGYASDMPSSWRFTDNDDFIDVPIVCRMTSNNFLALRIAACHDMGLLYIPEFVVRNDIRQGRLQRVLPEKTRGCEWGIYAVYPDRKSSLKTRALIDFIKARLAILEQDIDFDTKRAPEYWDSGQSRIYA